MHLGLMKLWRAKLGFAKFVSWIGVPRLRESNELELIVGEDCFTANTVIQSLAKKVIEFWEPIYHFEVRDVNYNTMKKSRSFSLLQRKLYWRGGSTRGANNWPMCHSYFNNLTHPLSKCITYTSKEMQRHHKMVNLCNCLWIYLRCLNIHNELDLFWCLPMLLRNVWRWSSFVKNFSSSHSI